MQISDAQTVVKFWSPMNISFRFFSVLTHCTCLCPPGPGWIVQANRLSPGVQQVRSWRAYAAETDSEGQGQGGDGEGQQEETVQSSTWSWHWRVWVPEEWLWAGGTRSTDQKARRGARWRGQVQFAKVGKEPGGRVHITHQVKGQSEEGCQKTQEC